MKRIECRHVCGGFIRDVFLFCCKKFSAFSVHKKFELEWNSNRHEDMKI